MNDERMPPRALPPLEPGLAAAQFTAQIKRERRKQEARNSGIRLFVRGAVLALLSGGATLVGPPSYFTPLMVLVALGAVLATLGALKLFASSRI